MAIIRINVGSALNPKEVKLSDDTLLKDVMDEFPKDAQVTINGAAINSADYSKSLNTLGVVDDSHVLYSSKQNSGGMEA